MKKKMFTISTALGGALLTALLLVSLAPATPASASGTPLELRSDTNSSTMTVGVEGVSCASCALPIRHALKALGGVRDVQGGESKEQLVVRYEPHMVTVKQILDAIERAGYTARLHD